MTKKITLNKSIETDYFRIADAGFYYTELSEQHGEWLYPTVNDRNSAGWFSLDAHNMVTGDFNGDGNDDVAFIWAVFPHVLERNSPSFPTIFISDGKGGLGAANAIIDGPVPERHMLYRSASADFNLDGRDDLIMTSMGLNKRDPTQPGGFKIVHEPIAYLLSGPDNKLRDASYLVEGQESGGLPEGFSFGHDLSVGDLNGDGYPDLYTGKVLFLNNGDGSLRNATDLLPETFKLKNNFLMSSAISDLNNDGIDDLIISYSEPEMRYALLSDGKDLAKGQVIHLPSGTYGNNTKSNFIETGDINGDGLVDVVIAETRVDPYYVGQHLQILINRGNGLFNDETKSRINNSPFDEHHGEGQVYLADINQDGHLDIVHATGQTFNNGEFKAGGLDVFMNRGDGHFLHVPNDYFASIANPDIVGYEMTSLGNLLTRALPIDLDGSNGLDFVSFKQLPFTTWPQVEPNAYFSFSSISTTPINRLPFESNYVALDVGKGEIAGSVYRLYKAAFDRTPDMEGLGYWIDAFDHGADLTGVASSFIASPEFAAMYGANSTDTNFVTLLYNHVLHRDPDAEGNAYWLNALQQDVSRGSVLASFSESPENIAQTAQLIANGIQYQEWVG